MVSKNIINYINQEMEKLNYGKIIVEIREKKVDVIVENRQRFENNNYNDMKHEKKCAAKNY